jgi:hypothetical protein
VLAMMFFDQFGSPCRVQWRQLAELAAQIDDSGLKFLLKIQRANFQVLDAEEHRESPLAILPNRPAEARQEA